MSKLEMPKAGSGRVLSRMIAWVVAFLPIGLSLLFEGAGLRTRRRDRGERVVAALTGLGGSAVQVGRQLALRLDLLPLDVATALLTLRDKEPPFPIDSAIARVEAAGGQPLDVLFESFDPEPLSSSSLSCEYHAVLRSGKPVVVRVRRPGVRARYAVELRALSLFTLTLERLTVLRPAFLETLRAEMTGLITEELDFRNQARYQTLFRRRARRDRLSKVSAARVHRKILSDDVMVSEFVSGVRLSEVISARLRQDRDALTTLREMDIDPKKVGRRLLEASWWGLFENQFFDAEPDPDAIVVQPGGKLVFVGFGEFFTALGKTRRTLREALTRLSEDDVTGGTEVLVQSLAPLPFIDTHAFSKRLEARIWQVYFALEDKTAELHERTAAGMTMAVLRTAGEDGVPVRADVAGMLRSLMLYDTLAMRLHPSFLLLDEFTAYLRRAERRAARRFRQKVTDNVVDGGLAGVQAAASHGMKVLSRVGFWVESMTENLPISNLSMTSKGSHVASELLSLVMRSVVLLVGLGVALGVWRIAHGEPVAFRAILQQILGNPIVRVLLGLYVLATLRSVQFRLLDKDPNE